MKFLEDAIVLSNQEIRPGIWSMWLQSPQICKESSPGQFVHLRVEKSFTPLLRRPLSIGRVLDSKLELVWRVVGTGTRLLAGKKAGDTVNLLGPLGEPFGIDSKPDMAILVGGGLGLPPLVYLNELLKDKGIKTEFFLGVGNVDGIPLSDEDPVLDDMIITSERGNSYRKGFVTEPVLELINSPGIKENLNNIALYSCGPWGLIGALKSMIPVENFLRCEVSLEQQMGCGIGVCQGCAIEVKNSDQPFKLVCNDGPVFSLKNIEVPNGS